MEIKENGFTAFEIPITQNMRLLNDFPLWFKKIHPTYWISNDDVLKDILMGTSMNWLLWLQLAALIGTLSAEVFVKKYRKQGEYRVNS